MERTGEVLSFYDIAHTWDGNLLWPKQMTDFSVYFKKEPSMPSLPSGNARPTRTPG